MGYVTKNLMANEDLTYEAKIHWIIYVNPVLMLLLGVFVARISVSDLFRGFHPLIGQIAAIIGLLIILSGLFEYLKAFILSKTTELAVTNRRIIAKFGFIRRNTVEVFHHKVESVNVTQGIIGRLLNYGTINITGTGGRIAPVRSIWSPIRFRNEVMKAIESA